MKAITIHDQAYEYYTWADLGEAIFLIAKQIIESGEKFDRIIALAKGGLTFSRSLVDYLNINDVSSFQIEFYSVLERKHKTPVITQSLPVSVRGERVLVFDDVVDKGDTMELAVQYLNYHGVKEIMTSALVTKPWSKFKIDFSAFESQAWVIFPNEARETIETLTSIWTKKGDSPEVVRKQLLEIGFPKEEVALFAKLD